MSATSGVALGGAAIGGLFFGPVGFAIGGAVGGLIGGAIFGFGPGLPDIEGPRLSDLSITNASYGKGIPIVFGSAPVSGNLIWATEIVEVKKKKEVEAGKSMGGGEAQNVITFSYFGNFAIAFAEGVSDIRRLWADGRLIINKTSGGKGRRFKYGIEHYRIYQGDELQLPDPLIEQFEGFGNVPGHRGLTYIVFDNLPLKDFGNRIPIFKAEIVRNSTTSFGVNPLNVDITVHNDMFGTSLTRPITIGHNGTLMHRWNRISDRLIWSRDMNDDSEAQLSFFAEHGTLNISSGTTNAPFVDPVTNDFYIGVDNGNAGGLMRFYKNGDFVLYQRSPSFLGRGTFGGVVVLEDERHVWWTDQSTNMQTITYTPSPPPGTPFFNTDGAILNRTLSFFEIPHHASHGSIDAFDHAWDPQFPGRAWVLSKDGSDNAVIRRFRAGASFDDPVNMNTDKGMQAGIDPQGMGYDLVTDSIILVGTGTVWKLDPETLDILDSNLTVGQRSGNTSAMWRNQSVVNGNIYLTNAVSEFSIYSTRDLRLLKNFNLTTTHPGNNQPIGPHYDPVTDSLWGTFSGVVKRLLFENFTADEVTLASIVTDLVSRSGLSASDIDTTGLTKQVHGYKIDSPTTARKALEQLQTVCFFDAPEVDHKLIFKDRGGATARTLTQEDLSVAVEGSSRDQLIDEKRTDDSELARSISFSYTNQRGGLEVGTQHDQRILSSAGTDGTTRSRHHLDISVPITITNKKAREAVNIMLATVWQERTTYSFELPPRHIDLAPGDIITITLQEGVSIREVDVRIITMTIGAANVSKINAVAHDSLIYNPNVDEVDITGNESPDIGFSSDTKSFFLNLPTLLTRGILDGGGGAWWGGTPDFFAVETAWRGAVLFKATEINAAFAQIVATVDALPWAQVNSVVPEVDCYTAVDLVNSITVTMQTDFVPVTLTDLDFFDQGGLIHFPRTGEILQYRDVAPVAGQPDQYVLSHLLRARLGTEREQGAVIGDEVVWLLTADMEPISSVAERNLERFYQAITIGENINPNGPVSFTNTSRSLQPLAPADFLGSRDVSDNLDLTWKHRTRFDGEWADLIDVPLNEVDEEYEIDILDGPSLAGASVVKTVTGLTSEAYEYLIADQQADFAHAGSFPADKTGDVVNNGFEDDGVVAPSATAVITGWGGARTGVSTVEVTASEQGTVPDTGSFFLFADFANPGSIRSDEIHIGGGTPVFSAANIDAQLNRFEITITARVAAPGGSPTFETASIGVEFLDKDLVQISETIGTLTVFAAGDTYENRTIGPVAIPVGAEFVRIILQGGGITGQTAWDSITVFDITDTDSGAVQAFAFDVYQISDTVGRGIARRTVVPAVGADQN